MLLITLFNTGVFIFASRKLLKSLDQQSELIKLQNQFILGQMKETLFRIKEIREKFDNLFILQNDKPSPNQISKNDDKTVDLNSLNPTDLPKNVKLEIEGGDNFIPYGY